MKWGIGEMKDGTLKSFLKLEVCICESKKKCRELSECINLS